MKKKTSSVSVYFVPSVPSDKKLLGELELLSKKTRFSKSEIILMSMRLGFNSFKKTVERVDGFVLDK